MHGDRLAAHVRAVRAAVANLILADVSTLEEGLAAQAAGADLVGTTLSGYTADSPPRPGPDLALVEALATRGVRTVAEGRISTPGQGRAALDAGALFIVVGGAITDPRARTALFAAALGAGRDGG